MTHFHVRLRGYDRRQVHDLVDRVERWMAGSGDFTAHELRGYLDGVSFDVVLRGYDPDEVHTAMQEWIRRLDGRQPVESVQGAMDGEMRLLDPEVRSSATLIAELLDPDFTEIGSSGRLRDRAAIMETLPREFGTTADGFGAGGCGGGTERNGLGQRLRAAGSRPSCPARASEET
ncbi:DUF4440 domain-containing protein [Nonomuraea sp. NPDC048916]|uniref:DUF4440 domain-containing protein n=1 Tax=Nonomuraea sp. NPDC048916 TaxID=3154232 RepID=UPI0033F8D501